MNERQLRAERARQIDPDIDRVGGNRLLVNRHEDSLKAHGCLLSLPLVPRTYDRILSIMRPPHACDLAISSDRSDRCVGSVAHPNDFIVAHPASVRLLVPGEEDASAPPPYLPGVPSIPQTPHAVRA